MGSPLRQSSLRTERRLGSLQHLHRQVGLRRLQIVVVLRSACTLVLDRPQHPQPSSCLRADSRTAPSITSRTTSMIFQPHSQPIWDDRCESVLEERRELSTAYMDALVGAPHLKKLGTGPLGSFAHERLLELLSARPIQALVYRPRGALELSLLQMDGHPFLLSLPRLRFLAFCYGWRPFTEVPRVSPPGNLISSSARLTILIITCGNATDILGVVKTTGQSLMYAKSPSMGCRLRQPSPPGARRPRF